MIKINKHRNVNKAKWLSTDRGGFTVPAKVPAGPRTTRSHFDPVEPYEDPNPVPDFVRSEKAFLK